MPSLLLTVEDVFELRGCPVVTGVFPGKMDHEAPLIGQLIELRLPGGTLIQSQIKGVEWKPTCCFGDSGGFKAIMLPPEITKTDVPIGTQVWSLD